MAIPGTPYWIGCGIYIDNIEAAKAEVDETINSVVSKNTTWVVGVLAAIFVFGVLPLSWLIVKSITGPIAQSTRAADDIASGNVITSYSIHYTKLYDDLRTGRL